MHDCPQAMNCFAALAMTLLGFRRPCLNRPKSGAGRIKCIGATPVDEGPRPMGAGACIVIRVNKRSYKGSRGYLPLSGLPCIENALLSANSKRALRKSPCNSQAILYYRMIQSFWVLAACVFPFPVGSAPCCCFFCLGAGPGRGGFGCQVLWRSRWPRSRSSPEPARKRWPLPWRAAA